MLLRQPPDSKINKTVCQLFPATGLVSHACNSFTRAAVNFKLCVDLTLVSSEFELEFVTFVPIFRYSHHLRFPASGVLLFVFKPSTRTKTVRTMRTFENGSIVFAF